MNFYEAFEQMKKGKKVKIKGTENEFFEIRKFAGKDEIVETVSGLPLMISLQHFEILWEVV